MEWLKANPEELEIVSNGMVVLTKNTRTHIRATLSSLFPLNLRSEVLIVDVGGGRGDALHDLRTARPDLEGRMIVQDLPEVIAGMKDTPGVEAMGHDFSRLSLSKVRLFPYSYFDSILRTISKVSPSPSSPHRKLNALLTLPPFHIRCHHLPPFPRPT